MNLRGRSLRLISAALAAVAAPLLPAWGADIDFRSTASVSASCVLLKDVATVRGGDPATLARLGNVVLAPAPAPGRRSRLDFDEIRSRLEASGLTSADLNYSGSTVIVVSSTQAGLPAQLKPKSKSGKVAVSPAQVQRAEKIMVDAVRHALRAKHRDAKTQFVEVVVEPADVAPVLAGAPQGLEVGPINPAITEVQNVDVRFENAQGQVVRFQVQCVIADRPQIPVLTHSVSSGEVIHEGDLAWKPVDNSEGLLTRMEEIAGKEAKKSLHAEEPLHGDDLRTVPLVRANDIVTGVWRSGRIRITGQFKAKSDGGRGDLIALVKLTGREQVMAVVTDLHEAEVVTPDQGAAARKAARNADTDADDGTDAGANPKTALHARGARRTEKPRRPAPPARATELVGGENR